MKISRSISRGTRCVQLISINGNGKRKYREMYSEKVREIMTTINVFPEANESHFVPDDTSG